MWSLTCWVATSVDYRPDATAVGPKPSIAPGDFAGLVSFINQLNAEWVDAARRISSGLLVDFLR